MPSSETPLPDNLSAVSGKPGNDPLRAMLERDLHLLGDLMQAGLVMAQAVARAMEEPAPGRPFSPREVCDLVLAVSRVERAVRYSVMLRHRLINELLAYDAALKNPVAMTTWQARNARSLEGRGVPGLTAEGQGADAAPPAPALSDEPAMDRALVEEMLFDGSEQIDMSPEGLAEFDPEDRADLERLRDDPRIGPMLWLPIDEVIRFICRDLGVGPDWLRLSEDAYARGEAFGGQLGEAFAAAVLSGAPPEGALTVETLDRFQAGRPPPPLSRPSWRPPVPAAEAPRRRRATG